MAIKIIKQGVKEFHITCPYCGCEFTYENEDVCNSEVICPCCSTNLPHKGAIGTVNTNPSPMPIWYNQQVAPDGYKIRGGLNKATDKCDDLVYRPSRFPTGQRNRIIGAVAKVARTTRNTSKRRILAIPRVSGARKTRGR